MATTRSTLKNYFRKHAIPTEVQFAELIESSLNQAEDGISKLPNDPLKITATGPEEGLINFYQGDGGADTVAWQLKQKDGNQVGFNIADAGGRGRLFIDSATGNVGLGTPTPNGKLHVLDDENWASMILGRSEGGGFVGFNSYHSANSWRRVNTTNDGVYVKANVSTDDPSTQLQIGFVDHTNNSISQAMVVRKDGRVGIGTPNPFAFLDVHSTNSLSNSMGCRIQQFGTGQKTGIDSRVDSTSTHNKIGITSVATGNEGTKYGLRAAVRGDNGTKYGVESTVNGDNGLSRGLFSSVVRSNNSNTNNESTGVYGLVFGGTTNSGTKYGIRSQVTGDAGTKYGLSTTVSGSDGIKYGVLTSVQGHGSNKYGIQSNVSGDSGHSYGLYGSVSRNNSSTSTSFETIGVYGLVFGDDNDNGTKYGIRTQVTGNAGTKYGHSTWLNGTAGNKTGLFASVNGDGGQKIGVQLNINGKDGAKFGLSASVNGENGNKTGGNFSVFGKEGNKNGITASAGGENGQKIGMSVSTSGNAGNRWGINNNVSGDNGASYGLWSQINRSNNSANTSSEATGVYSRVFGGTNDAGPKFGLRSLVTGDAGTKWGIHSSVSGKEGDKYGIQSNISGDNGTFYGIISSVSRSNNSTNTNRETYGVYGLASGGTNDAGNKFGVRGQASGEAGTKYGVYGHAFGKVEQGKRKCGVYGVVSNNTGDQGGVYAGFFQGNVHINGTLSKNGGSFLIDHPLDPLNKTLRHNFVESPEDLCLYRGKVGLNQSGKAAVKMPSYFAALTKEDEATVLLTPIGKSSSQLSYTWNDKFTEFTVTGTPNGDVAYLVLANRDDPVMHQHACPVEEEKGGRNFEKGKLLCPEAFGHPKEMGIDFEENEKTDRNTEVETVPESDPEPQVEVLTNIEPEIEPEPQAELEPDLKPAPASALEPEPVDPLA